MSGQARLGRPQDEMFLNRQGASAAVEPLRIHKRESAASPPPPAQAGNMYSVTPPPDARMGTSPAPYPDDRTRMNQVHYPAPGQAPYPENMNIRTPEVSASGSSNRTASTSPNHQNRNEYPQALRAGDGRETTSKSALAERRGAAPRPLPESTSPELAGKDGLFQKPPSRGTASNAPSAANSYLNYDFPPPGSSATKGLGQLSQSRSPPIDRNPSTSTTRAQRGSPPPPETPVVPPGHRPTSDIEARYAAAGIAGTSTLTGLQAQSMAAQQRSQQYANQQQQPKPAESVRRPWTPTEQPGSQPHGPPTVYQGPNEISSQPAAPMTTSPPPVNRLSSGAQSNDSSGRMAGNALENDLQRLNVSEEPPPAYSTVSGGGPNAHYTGEKHRLNTGGPAAGVGSNATGMSPEVQGSSTQPISQVHPAFANDPNGPPQQSGPSQPITNGATGQQPTNNYPAATTAPAQQQATPASPPPLPEGWIAHLDPNSGQYYYIHLPTQATQWEFPKGPTPLNLHDAPTSPIGSVYNHPLSPSLSFAGKPMPSPGMPMSPGAFDTASVMSFGTAMGGPSAFTGPPPSSGVDIYKVLPTNGVYFGPYLRYMNMDIERGLWLGSILLITDAPQPPTIHIHQSIDLSPNPRQLKALNIAKHQRWTFYKYEIDLQMEEHGSSKWTYAITSHLGCTRYEFLVAGRSEIGWRFIATSGNDFSLNVNMNERNRVGGAGYMWKDIMQKHGECGGFHVQLGLGGQINADRLWKEIPSLKQWLATSGKENRKNATWTAAHEEDVSHAYFHYYTSHFDQPYLREAFAQIPHILTVDDHDIFDGFGSYPEYMQFSSMFKNIGRIGIEMYLLFQHHTTLELLRNVSTDIDLFTITGTGWHFIKYLGPCVVVVGPDIRSERNPHQVMAGPTYQGLFPKVAMLPQSVQHCIWLISVPIVYPRLEGVEQFANTVATGKKAVTATYNMLGKVTSSVAGVVGAKGAVGSGFDSIKRAVGKSGLMGGILSPFGDIDVLDELRDQWTHDSKDLERTYLIRTLQRISHERSIRCTFLSGSSGIFASGLLHDPSHPSDHKTMYQLITSYVVNTPPPPYVVKLLASSTNKLNYVPANGVRSPHHSGGGATPPTDTKEDIMEIFQVDPSTGQAYRAGDGARKVLGRRGYIAMVAYDPEVVRGTSEMGGNGSVLNDPITQGSGKHVSGYGKLSLAADFMVQADGWGGSGGPFHGGGGGGGAQGAQGAAAQGQGLGGAGMAGVVKYGPVVVPCLEFGR